MSHPLVIVSIERTTLSRPANLVNKIAAHVTLRSSFSQNAAALEFKGEATLTVEVLCESGGNRAHYRGTLPFVTASLNRPAGVVGVEGFPLDLPRIGDAPATGVEDIRVKVHSVLRVGPIGEAEPHPRRHASRDSDQDSEWFEVPVIGEASMTLQDLWDFEAICDSSTGSEDAG